MTDQFHASLKLITGEEVLARIAKTVENGFELFLLDDAIVLEETNSVDPEQGTLTTGLAPRRWMNFGGDGVTVVYKDHIISISEMDKYAIEFYEKAVLAARISSPVKKKLPQTEHTGYLGSTDEYRKYLEKMYKNSPDIPSS